MITTIAMGLVFSVQAFAGMSNTSVECQSAQGDVKLEGGVPGGFAEFTLKATAASEKGQFQIDLHSMLDQQTGKMDENGHVAVVEDLSRGVYTIKADGKDENTQQIELYAYPQTFRMHKQKYGGFSAEFTGQLTMTSENGWKVSKVKCSIGSSI